MRPVVAIYSTFLQRAYDMSLHDVALQRLPVIFAIDRAGLVGEDGGTHHGAFDLSYLRSVPGMVIMAPSDGPELASMLRFALEHVQSPDASPVAIRYPRGTVSSELLTAARAPLRLGRSEVVRPGEDVVFLAVGSMVAPAMAAAKTLAQEGIQAGVVNVRFVKPLDETLILDMARRLGRLIVCEENSIRGGFGEAVAHLLIVAGMTEVEVRHFGIPDRFIEHGSQAELRRLCHLTAEDFANAARELVRSSVHPTVRRLGQASGRR